MTKADLVTIVSRKTSREHKALTEPAIKAVIDAAMETIVEGVQLGEAVTLRGFGTFSPKIRKPKLARNIAAGTTLLVPAKTVLVFKPAKEVNKGLNP